MICRGLLDRPIRLANDANCFALSEATDGAGAGAGVGVRRHHRHGTGGGVVVDRRVLTGANGVAGEWGHNPLPAPREGESPGPRATAGAAGASRRSSRGRAWRAITPTAAEPPSARRRLRLAAPRARRWQSRRSNDTKSAWPARWAASSTFSTRTSSCSAAGCRISAGCTSASRSSGARMCSPTGSRRAWRGLSMATRAASAARRGCGEPGRGAGLAGTAGVESAGDQAQLLRPRLNRLRFLLSFMS